MKKLIKAKLKTTASTMVYIGYAIAVLIIVIVSFVNISSGTNISSDVNAASVRWLNDENFSTSHQKKVNNWLTFAVNATHHSFGVLPFNTIDFRIELSLNHSEPVPWGQVNRIDNSIFLQISPNFGLASLKKDWTIYHEIAHLYLPFLNDHETWLSEGFATYIQHITMLQANMLTKEQAITRIEAGFSRGKANMRKAKGSLYQVSSNMHYNRAYMRVYWSGAGFFIEADAALQQQGKNLTTIIAKYSQCCLTKDGTAKQLIKDLDRLSSTSIFSTLYLSYKYRRDFPAIKKEVLAAVLSQYQLP